MSAVVAAAPRRIAVDKLGVFIAGLAVIAACLPLVAFRANRIVPGEGLSLLAALPGWQAALLALTLAAGIGLALLRTPVPVRLAASLVVLAALWLAAGAAASHLTPADDKLARVSPGSGFWLLLLAFALLAADGIARLRLGPWPRIAVLLAVASALALLLASGLWRDLSILREYSTRAESFWREAATHVVLAFGSLAAATLAGIPIGIACHRKRALRTAVLNVLNAVQTIPSIALFGLLIAPLAWVAANVPGAALLGISGIGAAPAMVALVAYSLLPVVANTVVGLAGVPAATDEAARGMGMTDWQRLTAVQLPLAFPVILAGIRIVLVQNIGLATIAALIGGGGFGVFVFQGIGQTAMDLVLLGAAPTVALAFAAAVVLDAIIELSAIREPGRD
ncbi:MAG: ABC transporter permease [Devosia sp.]|nr:ABC transporter permease [Devosia sp.]